MTSSKNEAVSLNSTEGQTTVHLVSLIEGHKISSIVTGKTITICPVVFKIYYVKLFTQKNLISELCFFWVLWLSHCPRTWLVNKLVSLHCSWIRQCWCVRRCWCVCGWTLRWTDELSVDTSCPDTLLGLVGRSNVAADSSALEHEAFSSNHLNSLNNFPFLIYLVQNNLNCYKNI